MYITIRQLGEHRGAPRLYLDTVALANAGFLPGTTYTVHSDDSSPRVTVTLCGEGDRRVSKKKRGRATVPVIDINNADHLGHLWKWGTVRVVIRRGVIHILTLPSRRKAVEREARLAAKLRSGEPLLCGSIAFGAGIASHALHAGLADGGVSSTLAVANEISDSFADVAIANHPLVDHRVTAIVNVPMQEAVMDDWMLGRLPRVEILEAGIPCSGASRAGASKLGLAQMEDHPHVGHLVASVIQWIHALQPTLFLAENVPSYATSASAAILRGWLRDAGYAIAEAVLDARLFGSLEARSRWFLVASPPALRLVLDDLEPRDPIKSILVDLLDAIGPEDDRFRTVNYLKEKADRDRRKGSGFGMQLLTPDSTSVPTLRKGYHKGGSTDPRLVHPTDPERSRLLTGAEHARIKGVDPQLVDGLCDTMAHMICGQAVDTRPVRAIGKRLAEAMLQGRQALGQRRPSSHQAAVKGGAIG